MSRYFFHIRRNGAKVLDQEGDDFVSADEAHASAVNSVRELVAARIKGGMAVSDEHMDVCNEVGDTLFSISFHDVVRDQLRE